MMEIKETRKNDNFLPTKHDSYQRQEYSQKKKREILKKKTKWGIKEFADLVSLQIDEDSPILDDQTVQKTISIRPVGEWE